MRTKAHVLVCRWHWFGFANEKSAVCAGAEYKRSLCENIRSLFFGFKFDSMKDILIALLYGFKRDYPVILEDPPPS